MLSFVEIVKSATVVIAMIVAFACLGQAEERRRILPDQIVAILSRDFPGWVLIDNSEVIRQPVLSHLKLDTTQSQPNLVRAHDAIDAVIIEKAAVTYVYDRGTFRAITTAD